MSLAREYFGSFKSFAQMPMIKQLIFMFGVAGGVALGIVLYMSIQEPTYRPLDYQVTSQNMAAIVDTLDKAGIHYKLNEQDNMIMVPAKDLQLAKLKLSASGVPKDDGFNFSFLNDQNNIANSQFMENARYLRALENDLAKTIKGIEGVSSARVHIAIPQNNVFADENERPTASVFLTMGAGLSSDKDKIRSIVQIISGSVPGLDPKDVSITDQYGHYLSGEMDANSLINAEQLSYQNNIQGYYEKRIESMLVPMVGTNKISVRVYANIDYTQQEEAKEQYDPDEKAIRSEESISEESGSGGASGPPGSLSNSPPEGGAGKPEASSGSSNGRNESIKNYEVGKSVSYKKTNAAKITNLSVAVVLDNDKVIDPKTKKMVSKPIDPNTVAKIVELVKATIGYNEARGDKVTVINSNFSVEPTPELIEETHFWNQIWFWDLVKKTIGIILGFIMIFIIYKRLNNFMNSTVTLKQVLPPPTPPSMIGIQPKSGVTPEMHQFKQEQINKLKELANLDPNKVASVIKNWVGK